MPTVLIEDAVASDVDPCEPHPIASGAVPATLNGAGIRVSPSADRRFDPAVEITVRIAEPDRIRAGPPPDDVARPKEFRNQILVGALPGVSGASPCAS